MLGFTGALRLSWDGCLLDPLIGHEEAAMRALETCVTLGRAGEQFGLEWLLAVRANDFERRPPGRRLGHCMTVADRIERPAARVSALAGETSPHTIFRPFPQVPSPAR
jgi:hypothetical protein